MNTTTLKMSRFPKREATPTLTFSPLAWLKLRMFLHTDEVEVGGFGISSEPDLLYVEDFVTVRQSVTEVTVAFDDAAVADHFDRSAEAGIPPARCGRLWIHTHPGRSAQPSLVDEQTFARVFGACDWAAMIIVARSGASYARLSFSAGPGGQVLVPVQVDWERWPAVLAECQHDRCSLDQQLAAWQQEYAAHIHSQPYIPAHFQGSESGGLESSDLLNAGSEPSDLLDELYAQSQIDQEFAHTFEQVGSREIYPW